MNPKRILWAIVPMVLLPYLALLMLFAVFFSTRQPWLAWVMETLFFNNAWYLIAVLLLYCLLTVIIQIVVFTAVMRRRCDALSLAKGAVLLKLFQAPAYILILIAGILLSFTIFTLPFAIGLFLLDCLMLLLSGLWTAAAAIHAVRQGIFETREVIWAILLQAVFCADVIAAVLFCSACGKRYQAGRANTSA